MNVQFRLTGLTPLLMHQDSILHTDEVKAWQKDPANKTASVAGDDRSPAWVYQGYMYNDGESVVMPSENIMVCLRQAGAQMTLKGSKTYKEMTQSGMNVATEFCMFTSGGNRISMSLFKAIRDEPFPRHVELAEKLGFKLWCKRAKIGQAKHVRVRPRFENWEVSGEMKVFNPELTKEIIVKLFELAGRSGIGDWRPGCKTPGPFGMFSAALKFLS